MFGGIYFGEVAFASVPRYAPAVAVQYPVWVLDRSAARYGVLDRSNARYAARGLGAARYGVNNEGAARYGVADESGPFFEVN